MSLGGFCRYWIEKDRFGGFSCPHHPETGSVSYFYNGKDFIKENKMPTLNTDILEGEWVSDEEWKRIRR